MTISSTSVGTTYNGDGVSTAFAWPYPLPTAIEMAVFLYDTAAETVNAGTLNAGGALGYTVTGSTDPDTGWYSGGATITMNTAPNATTKVELFPNTAPTQNLQGDAVGPFSPKAVMAALDRLTLLVQALSQRVFDCISLSPIEPSNGAVTILPVASVRANKILGFDNSGTVALFAAGTAASMLQKVAGVVSLVTTPQTLDLEALTNATVGAATIDLEAVSSATFASGGTLVLSAGGALTAISIGNAVFGSALGSATLAAPAVTLAGDTITLRQFSGGGGPVTLNGALANVTLNSATRLVFTSGGGITESAGGQMLLTAGTFTAGGGVVAISASGSLTMSSGAGMAIGSNGDFLAGSTTGTASLIGVGPGVVGGSIVDLRAGTNVYLLGNFFGAGAATLEGANGAPLVVSTGGSLVMESTGNGTIVSAGNITLGATGNVVLAGTASVSLFTALGEVFTSGTGAPGALANGCVYVRQDGSAGARIYIGDGVGGATPIAGV